MEMKLTKRRRRREKKTKKMTSDCEVLSLGAMDVRENGKGEGGAWRRRIFKKLNMEREREDEERNVKALTA